MDKRGNVIFTTANIMRITAICAVISGLLVAKSWWDMPYIQNYWYWSAALVITHLVSLALSIVTCILTLILASKKKKLLMILGIIHFALAAFLMAADLGQGFLPPEDMLVVAMLAFCYMIVAIISAIPDKNETLSKETLRKKEIPMIICSVISAVLAAFAILFPKGHEVTIEGQHADGPIEIFTQIEYSAFDYVLYALIPISLIALCIFLTCGARLSDRKKKVEAV